MPAGRPSELTEGIILKFAELLPRTMHIETVSDLIGIDRDTMRVWFKKGSREQRYRDMGREPRPELDLHVKLSGTIKKALSEQEANYVAGVQLAGEEGAWQALCWLLERRFKERWAVDKTEIKKLQDVIAQLSAALDRASHAPGTVDTTDAASPATAGAGAGNRFRGRPPRRLRG